MNWLRHKKIYFSISGITVLICIFSLYRWGFKLGVDFKGGTIAEYSFKKDISTERLKQKLEEGGIEVSAIQTVKERQYIFRSQALDDEKKVRFKDMVAQFVGEEELEEMRFETVGPSIGPELVKKTVYAVVAAAGAILLWVAYQFKSFKFGASAIIAMLHDTFILIGSFSLLSHFLGAEVDFLFVTALLTTLSFSVHDTIVVYDRIRESQSQIGGDLFELANKAISETMVRSLNNSFTIIFMLFALLLLGGSTIKWFAAALFIGTILGTYSSPFIAVPLLVSWDDLFKRFDRLNFRRLRIKR